jgi:cell division protein FtsB
MFKLKVKQNILWRKNFDRLKEVQLKTLGPKVSLLIIIAVCIFSVVWSKRGLTTLFALSAQLPNLNEKLDLLRSEKLRLENQAELLRESSLDLDLLDEKARKILDFAKPKESILIPKYNEN